jgi:hypothetical protein
METKNPITDMVREQSGDYIKAVEAMEESHADLLAALQGLFEHCVMVHKHWGDGCNRKQAKAAEDFALAAIAKAQGGAS